MTKTVEKKLVLKKHFLKLYMLWSYSTARTIRAI